MAVFYREVLYVIFVLLATNQIFMTRKFLSLLLVVGVFVHVNAQEPKKMTSGEIFEAIQKINFLGNVLYVAAHPDDENTRLISYFSNDVKARTAYLSLTRGDGGQNLIGLELRELLGLIRTNELLQARRVDGGEQFFSRANDFGYSKHADETLTIWDREAVLNDITKIINEFRPDVIINRFDYRTPGTTHGHHTSSAMLSLEAFDRAEKTEEDWSPQRLFFNTSWWFYGSKEAFEKVDKSRFISMDIGTYYPLKGLSNNEIASLSRSKHRSQGFGSTGSRGTELEYLELLKGSMPRANDIFEGINTSWSRVKGGQEVQVIMDSVVANFDFNKPSRSIPELLKAYLLVKNLEDSFWAIQKTKELKAVIYACSGLYLEAVSTFHRAAIGSEITVSFEAINRSDIKVELKRIEIQGLQHIVRIEEDLVTNKKLGIIEKYILPNDLKLTNPYWINGKGSLGMYQVDAMGLVGKPMSPAALPVCFSLNIAGVPIVFEKNIIYKYTSPVKGEVYRPFEIIPKAAIELEEKVVIFNSEASKTIRVKITAGVENLKGVISFKMPKGWGLSPEKQAVFIAEKGKEQWFNFNVTPPSEQHVGTISPIITVEGVAYTKAMVSIDYDHIPFQTVLLASESKLVHLDIAKKGNTIGYIHGAGDAVPSSLRQIGYTVVAINEEDITFEKIQHFDAIVMGIRAFNVKEKSKFYQASLNKYVENGGTMIVQYNTSHRLKVKQIGPYKLKLSRDRVTVENAKVAFLNPQHEVLNFPNKISERDFEGWVQERGLYFPDQWGKEYIALLEMNDPNESPKKGSLLVATYGKGYYIYTGLSFFRELPAGVPGAYRLFANMLSIGKNNQQSLKK